MSASVWIDANGFMRYIDHAGVCWRWDAKGDAGRPGWVPDYKYDLPDKEVPR